MTAKEQVFYSFHYQNDSWRAAQIRCIKAIEGNPVASSRDLEEFSKTGARAVKRWIDANMKYRSCVIVLVGSETAERRYVQYEIAQAWKRGKGLFGVYIHNLKDEYGGTSDKGNNPFDAFSLHGTPLSRIVRCYNPSPDEAYRDIAGNIENWIEEAIKIRKSY